VTDHDDAGGTGAAPAAGEPPEEPSEEGVSKGAPRRHMPFWQELALLLSIALVLAVGIKALFVQAFYIPSGSMNDTLVFNDRILVQKVSYWGSASPERGDIVVFADPGGWLDLASTPRPRNVLAKGLEVFGLFPTGGHLVKRVIGVGGDRVVCCDDDGRITVNGVALDESSYLRRGTSPSAREFDVTVPEGRLWMMGDNRGNSEDSRFHQRLPGKGTVPVDRVVGKVWAIVWPLDRLERVERPATFEQEALDAP
jgi:signal peptidase I